MVRSGQFRSAASSIRTFELLNKKILIMGFGRIGRILIKRCLGFEMKPIIYDPFVDKEVIKKYGGIKVESLDSALKAADFISVHLPLTDKTKNLIDLSKLKSMKKDAIIINTARGGIVNENDLDEAVKNNIIFGAGLDVFEKEPIQMTNPLIKIKRFY